jgi:O-antigen/teichoic acid export membrane protein
MDCGVGKDVLFGPAPRGAAPSPLLDESSSGSKARAPASWTDGGRGRKGGPWTRVLRIASGKGTLAVVDQAVVSGTSFLTTVLVGRWCGAGELGVYSLGCTLLVTWACVQESLIALPYTICRHRPLKETPAEYAGSVLVLQCFLSALALATLVGLATFLSWGRAVPGLAPVTWALAGVMPFALLREFGRRFAFAHLRMAEALVLDLAVAVVQLTGLFWLASTGALSASTAYVAVGVACALVGAIWLYLARGQFVFRWALVGKTFPQCWSLGRWFFASQLTMSVQGYFIHWLLAWLVGTTATGRYAACMTVVLFANPLILGISNALAPRAVKAFAEGGRAELRQVVFQTTLLLGLAMVLFCAAIMFAGEDVMGLLYHGPQYEGHGHAISILALAMLASALGVPASNGLAAVERPDVIFKIGLVAVGLSLLLVPCLVVGWGELGAAYGFLAGNVVGSVGRWIAYGLLVGKKDSAANSTLVTRVLQQMSKSPKSEEWLIEPLSEGAQASLFAVRRRDQQPVWQTHRELVVKLYKPTVPSRPEVIQGQIESMVQLHTRLGSRTINGWRIHAPLPVYQCEQPAALVMTKVPGRSVNSFLETPGQMQKEALESIADVVIAAMEHYWSKTTHIHGDLNFDNILCDVVARSLSLVDSGVVENDFLCDAVTRNWFPASRDLAYLLYDTGVSVRKTLMNPGARRRQEWLVECALRAFVKRIGLAGERHRLLNEIQACVQVHLNSLDLSWSARGLWHVVLRQVASRRINQILGRLRAEVGSRRDGVGDS